MKISMEQIIAGALLLGFDNISKVDLELLSLDFWNKNSDYSIDAEEQGNINRYIKTENDKISLKEGLTLDSYLPEEESSLRVRLEQMAREGVRRYIETFNMEEYLLRKIKHYTSIEVDNIDNFLCKMEQEELAKLDEKGYITSYWEEDCIYDDTKVIALSDYGKVQLFKIDRADEVGKFKEKLRTLRYDVNALDDFLLKQDLELGAFTILNIVNFRYFCSAYDRAITEPGASYVDFERLKSKNDNTFNEESKNILSDMLSVWDDGHCIYICHPNHIFDGTKLLTKDVRDINYVNWDDIDIEKMFKVKDYNTFIDPDSNFAFDYVHNRLGYQIINEVNKGNKNAVSYLTVIEKYRFDYEDYYLVRGFIKGDAEGYSIAFNPEYKEIIPKSVFEKSLRFSGDEVPNAYCLKRKK